MQYTLLRSYRLHDVACFDPITPTLAMAGLAAANTAVSAAGTLAGGDAAVASAQRAQQRAESQARYAEQDAQQSRAMAQRVLLDKRRQGDIENSNAIARMVARGGSAQDSDVLNVLGRLAGDSEYRAEMAAFPEQAKAKESDFKAMLFRMSGEDALADGAAKYANSRYQAANTILSSASSFAEKFKPK